MKIILFKRLNLKTEIEINFNFKVRKFKYLYANLPNWADDVCIKTPGSDSGTLHKITEIQLGYYKNSQITLVNLHNPKSAEIVYLKPRTKVLKFGNEKKRVNTTNRYCQIKCYY